MKNLLKKHLKAFSIVETLLSMVILTVGLLSTTLIVAKSLSYSFDTRDTIIAIQLAQEGVELVRNVRDTGFRMTIEDPEPQGFDQFSNDRHCRVDYDDDPRSTIDCSSSQGVSSRYRLSPSGGFYQHLGAGGTGRFSRYVYVDLQNAGSGDPEARVVSFVYWDWTSASVPSFIPSNGNTTNCTLQNKCVYTESFLTNWKN